MKFPTVIAVTRNGSIKCPIEQDLKFIDRLGESVVFESKFHGPVYVYPVRYSGYGKTARQLEFMFPS